MVQASRKLILITGTTRGIGRAMAIGFAKLGHTVVGCGRTAGALARLREELGPPHDFTAVDVADDRQVKAWASDVLDRFRPPDLLLNNAALINGNAPLWKVAADEFDRVVDVNLKGVANVLRAYVPAMIEQQSGVIVNFSSGWGRSTAPEVAPYCATKWAIEGLTRALAQELPSGLAAVPLNPGIIDTAMLQSTFGGRAKFFPNPEAWAEIAVPFLLTLGPKDNGKPLSVPGQ
ncbi:SDR family oxidoreductase [Singulisphaera sp. Ch08]|uniref:SDR family oxidoreductase n=1 Tax=Singulisphaera sp. Ch08 TaxID=3120278 RepID=A0AAU7CJD6_9BACT